MARLDARDGLPREKGTMVMETVPLALSRTEEAPGHRGMTMLQARYQALLDGLRADPHDVATWRQVGGVFAAYASQASHTADEMLTVEVWFQVQVAQVYRHLLETHPLPADVCALLPPLTEQEELDERERVADERRRQGLAAAVEARGMMIQRFRDWAVTTAGVECMVARYSVEADALCRPDSTPTALSWEEQLRDTRPGLYGSYTDFLDALHFARGYFRAVADARGQAAQPRPDG